MATLTHKDIAKAIYLSTKGKNGGELDAVMKDSVRMLAKKNLLGKSEDILVALERIINKENGVVEVEVWSKDKLESHTRNELEGMLKKKYGDKKFKLKEYIDESLLGGFKVKVGDEVMDLTIKNKIKKLKEHLTRHE